MNVHDDRNTLIHRFVQDLERLTQDLEQIVRLSRTWPAESKAQGGVQNLRRDMLTLRAHAMSVFGEFLHMNAMRERLAMGAVDEDHRRRPPTVGNAHPPEAQPTPPPPDVHNPGHPSTMARSREDLSAPHPPDVHAPAVQPQTSTTVSKVVTNLPPEILAELRKQGLA